MAAAIAHQGQVTAGRWRRTETTRATKVAMPITNTAVDSKVPSSPDIATAMSVSAPTRNHDQGGSRLGPVLGVPLSHSMFRPGFLTCLHSEC